MTEPTPTPLDLDAIEARAEAASPSPWLVLPKDDEDYGLALVTEPGYSEMPVVGSDAGVIRNEDADFIAYARTDVPALIAEVRRLRAVLGCLGEAAWHAADGPDPVFAEWVAGRAQAALDGTD